MFKYLWLCILTTILIDCTPNAEAQHYFKTSDHRNIHLSPPERKIDATIDISAKCSKKVNRLYYWFDNSEIHYTQGGCGGYLLDGDYVEYFYPGNNLSLKGNFKKGLKNGEWQAWYENGNLKERARWKKGDLAGKKTYYTSTGSIYKIEKYRKNLLNGFTIERTSDTSVKRYFYKNGKLCSPTFWNRINIPVARKNNPNRPAAKSDGPVAKNEVLEPRIEKQPALPQKKKKGLSAFWSNAKSKWPF